MAEREMLIPSGRRSTLEQQADDVASEVALHGARPSGAELARGMQEALRSPPKAVSDQPIRAAVGARMGADLSRIRIVPNSDRAGEERSIAFAQHDEVHLAPGAYRPDHPLGRALLAHELTHSAQLSDTSVAAHDQVHRLARAGDTKGGLKLRICDSPTTKKAAPSTTTITPAAPTPAPAGPTGVTVRAQEDPQIEAYNLYDSIRVGLDEVRKGKALEFHAKSTRARVEKLCQGIPLNATDQATRLAEYDALLAGAPPKSPPKWESSRTAFLTAIRPAIVTQLAASGMTSAQQNANLNWLQNVPAQVFQLLLDVSNANVPPAYLYAAAVNEGLVDQYIRPQVASAGPQLSATQLASISITKGVSGFQALGLDRFFEEKKETKLPLPGYLPSGFNAANVTEETNVNEKGTTVRSAHVADLKTGLQVQAAILARRMDLFLDARSDFGYPAPTDEQKVYFGYVFYNSGASEGRRTLSAHKAGSSAPRTLGQWITLNEYANAQKVLRTYRFIVAAGLLKGF